ncbi:hypothetical protein SDRG_05526 [Saprolegnia diclina VS20]|uniref:BAG domain-containing protein n=1 Tax=Saprolegnia diclina (strain VS20) TaxID=1156394 RepID=T0QTF8_SAPDV|nr:hypothetical protein SDRG_05526 [Saprolegnia diclina VS20]EQC37305.1 hypothetical protein SDRG_05526 [Saprolegnia diclina VS20]|eukprot:XP_008609467.1 hypothetical protein SDRG_05526 [Saprolegnia diclina VS20]
MSTPSTSSATSQLAAIAGHIDRATDMVTSRLEHQRCIAAATLAASKWIMATHKGGDHLERVKQCKQRLGQYRARVLAQSERLTQLLMELDTIESNGDAAIRAERKRSVHRIQGLLKAADELLVKSERLLALANTVLLEAPTAAPLVSEPVQHDNEDHNMKRLLDTLPLWTPNAHFVNAGDSVVLRVDLAGVHDDSIDVSVTPEGLLQIAGYKFPTPRDIAFMHTHRWASRPRFGKFVVTHEWPRHVFDVANLSFRQLPTGVLEVVAARLSTPASYTVQSAATLPMARLVAGLA